MAKLIVLGIQLVISIINFMASRNRGAELKGKVFDAMMGSDKGFDLVHSSEKLKKEHEEVRKHQILKRR